MAYIYVPNHPPSRGGKKGFRKDAARSAPAGVIFFSDILVGKSLLDTVAGVDAAAELGLSTAQINDGKAHEVKDVFICYVERTDPNSMKGEDRVYGPITLHVRAAKNLHGDSLQFGWNDLKEEFEDRGTSPTPDGQGTYWIWEIKHPKKIHRRSAPP